MQNFECIILGAGPAGLAAAMELTNYGVKDILIIDRNSVAGGLSRTENFNGARFDIGPHRFFTKNQEINKLWHDTLGKDFIKVERLTRIFYKNKFFAYPLRPLDSLLKIGPKESLQAIFAFAVSRFKIKSKKETFEDWIIDKFGYKLYEIFFKTYTEKVWGIPCNEISAEWAAQRIKGLDLSQLIKNSLIKNTGQIKTLIEQFDYPVSGAGMMYEVMTDIVTSKGAKVMLNNKISAFKTAGNVIKSVEIADSRGNKTEIRANHFFNSIPITHFFKMLVPQIESEKIRKAAEALYYREHITVNLLVEGKNLFPDQWIYIHSPDVKMARLANYNNFSAKMVNIPNMSALSVEYFVFQNDDLWQMTDEQIIQLAIDELAVVKLINREAVNSACLVRETQSYPTYYIGYLEPYNILKNKLNEFENLSPIGRGGLYKYNNQDHSAFTGLLAARNYLKHPGYPYDIWAVNNDAEYHESGKRI